MSTDNISPGPVTASPALLTPELRAWRAIAWITGAFMLLLAVTLFIGHARVRAQDPWKSPRLAELKRNLRDNPKDEQIKQSIRALDLKLRQRYFLQMSRMKTGVYLLLGSAVVFVVTALRGRTEARRLPNLTMKRDEAANSSATAQARWSVVATGALVCAGLLVLGLTFGGALPGRLSGNQDQALASVAPTSSPTGSGTIAADEYQRNWPRFLGPNGNGSTRWTNTPTHWDATNGTGIAWKVPAVVGGFNSPIVWGSRVFYSGGNAEKREIVCLDANTGQELWREALTNVPGSPAETPEIPESTGFAAPTMATDGKRVYVIFANGDVGAYSFEGKRVWAKGFGPFHNPYGYANSLATWGEKLVLQLDQGESEDGKSKLVLLDGATGQLVWQKPRHAGSSWASPLVFEGAGKAQVALLSLPWVSAYAAKDGSELWKADVLNGEVTPSPIFAGGLVIVASPSDKLVGIRPDGQGDVTKTHLAWTNEDFIPDVTSPVSNGELVFMMTTSGVLTCVDAKDGKKAWEKDYELEFHASPAIAGNHLYLIGQKGLAVVAEAGREYKELFRTEMPDAFHASPALVDGRIYLRGVTNVWCLK